MKSYIIVFILGLLSFNSVAQLHKRFIKENGKVVKDSTKADAYLLYKKIGIEQDSVWAVLEYDKQRVPIMKGYYLDEDFTIPHGRFDFYKRALRQKKAGDHLSVIDTIIYISETGFFNNGLKEGMWVDYFNDGTKQYVKRYQNDKLNGEFDEYSFTGKLYSRGDFVDDKREGKTYIFRPDSSIQSYIEYRQGDRIGYKYYTDSERVFEARPGYNFDYNIHKYLKKSPLPGVHGNVIVSFTVDENGKLIQPKIEVGINPAVDKAVIEAVNASPRWIAAVKNKKPIEQKVTFVFNYEDKNYGIAYGNDQ